MKSLVDQMGQLTLQEAYFNSNGLTPVYFKAIFGIDNYTLQPDSNSECQSRRPLTTKHLSTTTMTFLFLTLAFLFLLKFQIRPLNANVLSKATFILVAGHSDLRIGLGCVANNWKNSNYLLRNCLLQVAA